MDREKVIKGLEHCTSHDDGGVGKCVGCPYYGHDRDKFGCTGRLKEDALSLLKEQEAVSIKKTKEHGSGMHGGICPKCRNWIQSAYSFCGCCGQAVKWE